MQRQFIRALGIVLFSYIVIVYTGPELIFILLIANFVSIRIMVFGFAVLSNRGGCENKKFGLYLK